MKTATLLPLLPDLASAGAARALTPLRVAWRGNWFYRRLLKGQLTDHFAHHPQDTLPRRLEDADALLRGRFRFHGESVEAKEGISVFDMPAPSAQWLTALHGFDWLPALSIAGGEAARKLATNLIAQWIRRHGLYSEPVWSPQIMARRLVHLFSHGRLVVPNSEMTWRSKLFVSLREQARMLERIWREAPEGVPRLQAAAALALSGGCMQDGSHRLEHGLTALEGEVEAQILPDGGHISRSPEALLTVWRYLMMVLETLAALNMEPPHALRNAADRIATMVRFFRHGDGALALFQGGLENDARVVAGLLARDEVRGSPFHHARHSGYQRLAAGRTLVLMDVGKVPSGAHALDAHAGFLAFEFSSGDSRVVVNCGAGGRQHRAWNAALRATAAHSTAAVGDVSSASILPPGLARDLLGPRLTGGPNEVPSRRLETGQGWTVEASHDGYLEAFGITHERQMTISPQGVMLTGRDRLLQREAGGPARSFAIRFHIHPDVRVSRLEGGGILLKLPNAEGWRFRSGGGLLEVEESVYLGGEVVRRATQLVISGTLREAQTEVAWVFEQIVA
ncbi:MAG: heparinase II/III family protein [Alphaproteobacteria bacterium]|nr:heparinase II/III family protein [Alphaproteobacteria bacterium]